MPLVGPLAGLDRAALRAGARRELGVPDGARLLLVNGGSLGAARLTEAAVGLAARYRCASGPAAADQDRAGGPGGDPGAAGGERRGGGRRGGAVPGPDGPGVRRRRSRGVPGRVGDRRGAGHHRHAGRPRAVSACAGRPPDPQRAGALRRRARRCCCPTRRPRRSGWTPLVTPLLDDPARLAAMGAAADPGTHARAADLLAAEALALAGRPHPPLAHRPHHVSHRPRHQPRPRKESA